MLGAIETIQIFQRQPDPYTFASGQVIFQAGDPGDLMYGIIAGEVEICLNHKVVEIMPPGGVFGIGALMDAGSRPYTAIAKTDCKLAFLDKQRFLFAIQETPMFALGVMKSYSERVNRLARLNSAN